MLTLWTRFQSRFIKEDEGASLVEYALLLVLIAVVAIVVIGNLGESVSDTFETVDNEFSGVTPTTTPPTT